MFVDFRLIAMLLGLQPRFTKYCCFVYMWDNRVIDRHYLIKDWPKRTTFLCENSNEKFLTLIKPEDVSLTHLHIRFGLIKNFRKKVNRHIEGSLYLKITFPKRSEVRKKAF